LPAERKLQLEKALTAARNLVSLAYHGLPRILPHSLAWRVLTRHGALCVVPRRGPAPPIYRHPAEREWVRKLLDEIDPPSAKED
jgi:hypothetical protein